jgi:hypothetical protein
MNDGTTRARTVATVAIAVTLILAGCDATTPTPSPSTPTASTPVSSVPVATASPTPAPTPVPSPAPTSSPTPTPPPAAAAWPYRAEGEISQTLFPPDGRVVVVERNFDEDRFAVVVLDPAGRPMEGWPWSTDSGGPIAEAALGPDNSLYVTVRGEGSPSGDGWSLHRLSPLAEELPGFPVALPPVSFCALQAPQQVAYVTCEDEDEDGNTTGTILTAVRPDGTNAWAPIRLARLASLIGFQRNHQPVLAIYDTDRTVIRALAADGSTAWSTRAIPGDAFVDPGGRIRVTRHEFEEDACGAPIRTTYEVLGEGGTRLAGWPLVVTGWSSPPAALGDGSMVVARADGRVIRYTLHGRVAQGWPVRNVNVSFSCNDGSAPVVNGDRIAIAGSTRVTSLRAQGRDAGGWSTNPPGEIALVCASCTPGSGATVDPLIGLRTTYVATYDARRRPRVVAMGPNGVARGAGVVIGGQGAETTMLVLSDGWVWAVTTRESSAALWRVDADPGTGP